LNLLIVDDNAAIRRMIAAIVLPLAGKIWECADGAEAVSAYQEQRPDVVLMDIRMSGMDGIEATRRIKAADPAARIIVVTDYDDEDLRRAAMREGACGYALKDDLPSLVRLLDGLNQNRPGLPGMKAQEN
jgi:CheY-like chemotaxis protein